jgi:hypothetical protein
MYVNSLNNDLHKLKSHDDLAGPICFASAVQLCTLYAQHCVCVDGAVTCFRRYAHFHGKQ